LSSLRSYSTYSKEYKKIFHLKNIHLGHAAKSFGLREAPNEIAHNISHNRNSYNNNNNNNNNKETKGFNTIKKPFDQR
jgi:ATP-dependent RNA helicase DDX31/DBP7